MGRSNIYAIPDTFDTLGPLHGQALNITSPKYPDVSGSWNARPGEFGLGYNDSVRLVALSQVEVLTDGIRFGIEEDAPFGDINGGLGNGTIGTSGSDFFPDIDIGPGKTLVNSEYVEYNMGFQYQGYYPPGTAAGCPMSFVMPSISFGWGTSYYSYWISSIQTYLIAGNKIGLSCSFIYAPLLVNISSGSAIFEFDYTDEPFNIFIMAKSGNVDVEVTGLNRTSLTTSGSWFGLDLGVYPYGDGIRFGKVNTDQVATAIAQPLSSFVATSNGGIVCRHAEGAAITPTYTNAFNSMRAMTYLGYWGTANTGWKVGMV